MDIKDLLPEEVRQALPKIGETSEQENPTIQAKFFYPDFGWTWYAIEFDGVDEFYGLVDGFEMELGYFSLAELMANRGKLGCEIERDLWFSPIGLKELQNKLPRH